MLQPIRHLLVRPKGFRLGRASPVGIYTRGFNVPSQGAPNKNYTPLPSEVVVHVMLIYSNLSPPLRRRLSVFVHAHSS